MSAWPLGSVPWSFSSTDLGVESRDSSLKKITSISVGDSGRSLGKISLGQRARRWGDLRGREREISGKFLSKDTELKERERKANWNFGLYQTVL